MEMSAIQRKIVSLNRRYHPTYCHWNVTYRCNASCPYCHVSDHSSSDPDTRGALEILDHIAANGFLYLTISGGEPFLRKDILTILEAAVKGGFFRIGIMTNGSLLTREHTDFIRDHARFIPWIQISAFSHVPEVSDGYMGVKGALRNAIEHATRLREAGIKIIIAVNVFEFNLSGIIETRRFFEDRGFTVSLCTRKIICEKNRCSIGESEGSADFQRRFLSSMHDSSVNQAKQRMTVALSAASGESHPCGGLERALYIDPQGTIYPCQSLRDYPLGSILENKSASAILKESKVYHTLRSYRRIDFKACRGCRYFWFCGFCVADFIKPGADELMPWKGMCEYAKAVESLCIEEGVQG